MARKMYSCDFETTTDPLDCRVWSWRYTEIGNKNNAKIGIHIEEFMEFVQNCNGIIYFHNLRFDGEFIVNWLLRNGFTHSDSGKANTFKTVISKMGQWYKIDVCYGYKGKKKLHTEILDSLKKLPFTVKKIAQDFKMEILKGDIDYHKPRPVGYQLTDEEIAYLENDTEIIADALNIQFGQGLTAMTNGSDSLKGFKSIIGTKAFSALFPTFSLELDSDIRSAYRGGFTWLNDKLAGKEIGEGVIFDVNSLYPAQMYIRPLPYGMPLSFQGKYEYDEDYPLHISHIRCSFELKEGHIPMIQNQYKMLPHRKSTEYLKSSEWQIVDLYVTNIDWEMIQEHYYVDDVKYLNGWKFKQRTGLFNQFIDKWTYIKVNSTGAIKLLAKLMLNSLYGKFASNPDVTGKFPYLKEDGSTGFAETDQEFRDPVYTPMGIFITSWARYTTISAAQKCYDRIIYCDTDSIHLTGTDIPEAIADIIDDNKLGYWQHESTFKRGKYLRAKTYVNEIYQKEIEKNGEFVRVNCSAKEHTHLAFTVKCAGMTDKVKENVTFDNFQVGFSSFGKLAPKHVFGGIVLMDTKFTIK